MNVQDTAGQERFRTLTPSYYRGAQGAVLVYDISVRQSFTRLTDWISELDTFATRADMVRMLVGNKLDLDTSTPSTTSTLSPANTTTSSTGTPQGRQVTREEALRFARRHRMLFIEASAKTAEGVRNAFEELVRKVFFPLPPPPLTTPISICTISHIERQHFRKA